MANAVRGLTLLDLVVVLALVALLAWLVRLDRRAPQPVPGAGSTVEHRLA